MSIIKERSKQQFSKPEQYSFMKKHGIFFKEAFVFVDGLQNGDDVEYVVIGTKTYDPYPYIPKDTSIIPVGLHADTNQYYWNTYYIPQSALTEDGG
jgi:hypothetical protein